MEENKTKVNLEDLQNEENVNAAFELLQNAQRDFLEQINEIAKKNRYTCCCIVTLFN